MIDDSFIPPEAEAPTIESILVIPHTSKYLYYWINGSDDRHRASREKLLAYLVKLTPDLSPTLTAALMDYHATFLVLVGSPSQFVSMRPPKDMETPHERVQKQMRAFIQNPQSRTRDTKIGTQEAYLRQSRLWLREHRVAINRLTTGENNNLNSELPAWGSTKSL